MTVLRTGFESDPGDEQRVEFCPDCRRLVSTHSLFRDGLCPVYRFPMPITMNPMVPPGHVELHDDRGIVIRKRLW